MKAGAFMLALLWLSGATYAGYRLTERSFAWIDEPDFGLEAASGASTIDFGAIQDRLPQPGEDLQAWARNLPPETRACIIDVIGRERMEAALRGEETHPTPSETVAMFKCFE